MTGGYNKKTSRLYFQESERNIEKFGLPEWQEVLKLINSPLKGKKILDSGCGYGHEAAILSRRGARVFGLDASTCLVNIAKKCYPPLANNFLVGDVRKLPFKNNFFDLILCKYVLHYLPLPDLAFKEFFRCLKEDGKLIFLVHHPVSNLFFKKTKDYFKKERIKFKIFSKVAVIQFTHPLVGYFSKYFLEHFDLQYFGEYRSAKPLHPKINIPEGLLVKASKRIIHK